MSIRLSVVVRLPVLRPHLTARKVPPYELANLHVQQMAASTTPLQRMVDVDFSVSASHLVGAASVGRLPQLLTQEF
jgi:hypothetical protein